MSPPMRMRHSVFSRLCRAVARAIELPFAAFPDGNSPDLQLPAPAPGTRPAEVAASLPPTGALRLTIRLPYGFRTDPPRVVWLVRGGASFVTEAVYRSLRRAIDPRVSNAVPLPILFRTGYRGGEGGLVLRSARGGQTLEVCPPGAMATLSLATAEGEIVRASLEAKTERSFHLAVDQDSATLRIAPAKGNVWSATIHIDRSGAAYEVLILPEGAESVPIIENLLVHLGTGGAPRSLSAQAHDRWFHAADEPAEGADPEAILSAGMTIIVLNGNSRPCLHIEVGP